MKFKICYLPLISIILYSLMAGGCKKHKNNPYSDNGLPPAIQKGTDIFACRVNGEVWIAKQGRGVFNPDDKIELKSLANSAVVYFTLLAHQAGGAV